MSKSDFWQFFFESLEEIDSLLASRGVALPYRPFEAAALFVENQVVDFCGESKENYLEKFWFGEIFNRTKEWYIKRYGVQVFEKGGNEIASGVVLIYGTPFFVRIPVTLTRPKPNSDLIALHFPIKLLDGEDPVNWIENPPDLSMLPKAVRSTINDNLLDVCTTTRRLCVSLMLAGSESEEARALASGIRLNLDQGIVSMCNTTPEGRLNAIWDFHFAIEKALKAYIIDRKGAVNKTHDIQALLKRATEVGLPSITTDIESVFPCISSVIQARYGMGEPPSVRSAYEMYIAALRLVASCAEAMEHSTKLVSPGGIIYLKPLPWARSN